MKELIILAVVVVIALVGCTDATRASLGAYGDKATITCYSGGKVILTDESTGRVQSSESGAGLYYKSAKTGRFVRNYADCIVEQQG